MTRCTRIIGHMVTRNELDRYLSATLRWLRDITDVQYVHDDLSTDGTFEHLQRSGIPASKRGPEDPSFQNDESAFRSSAWQAMEREHKPTCSDWILCVDADEFVLAPHPSDTRNALTEAVERHQDAGAAVLPVKEVFGFDADRTPLVRIDGYWGQIEACRLVRWRPNAHFSPRVEGGGSIPETWAAGAQPCDGLVAMHLGYAHPADRDAKHERYSATSGHNPHHVASILQPPTLKRWGGLMSWPEPGTRS